MVVIELTGFVLRILSRVLKMNKRGSGYAKCHNRPVYRGPRLTSKTRNRPILAVMIA